MATELLVENRIEDGQKLIEQLVEDGFKIAVAFWIKTSEEGLWHLYLASPSFGPERKSGEYGAVYSALSKIPGSSLQFSDIRLIHVTNPIALEAIAARNRFPVTVPSKWGGQRLGNLSFDEAWIYPPTEAYFKGFIEIKRRYPSAEILTIPIPNPGLNPLFLLQNATPFSLLQNVSPFRGKINESEFEGKAPGTLLFSGSNISSRNPLAELVFIYRPEGWNKLFRADTHTWEEVIHVETGKKLYEEVDFGPLAAMKSPVNQPHP